MKKILTFKKTRSQKTTKKLKFNLFSGLYFRQITYSILPNAYIFFYFLVFLGDGGVFFYYFDNIVSLQQLQNTTLQYDHALFEHPVYK